MEIILIRHGKPEAAINPKVSAAGYANWIRHYRKSKVASQSRPSADLKTLINSHYIISSDLPRAVDSAMICTQQAPRQQHSLLRELEIPCYKLPLRMKAWSWLYLSRFLWTLRVPCSSESYIDARHRAELAAEALIQLAQQERKIAVFCHGYIIFFMRRYLKAKGWKIQQKSNQYWGVSQLSWLE